MLRDTIRAAAFVAALLAAAAAGATTRYWALQGVTLSDGALATGSFSYDDATGAVGSWLVRVQGSVGEVPYAYLPFTYLPGDSTAVAGTPTGLPSEVAITFSSLEGGDAAIGPRQLRITTLAKLDGSASTVGIDLATPFLSGSVECMDCGFPRFIVAGSIVLTPFPPPVAIVDVIEFYYAGLDHYFMSADPAEIHGLDIGAFAGWTRTGYSFKAFATGSSAGGTIHPVCRFYGLPSAGLSSHFYSATTHDCFLIPVLFPGDWEVETDNAFQIDLPDIATGACPAGKVPVYRLFNGRHDANHRYMASLAVRATMIAAGWIPEGYGPDSVAMCAVP